MSKDRSIRVAIDASNIRAGGGVTHLVECLGAYDPAQHGIKKVVLFGGSDTLDRVADRLWIERRIPSALKFGSVPRYWWWQRQIDRDVARSAEVLLVPGGSYLNSFRPFVVLAQNLLPFDHRERRREGLTLKRLRLHLLEAIQTRTFRRASGVVFMTGISRVLIERQIGFRPGQARVIHHGVNPRFFQDRKAQRQRGPITEASPLQILYLSVLEPYKHQDKVIGAVANLRARGLPVRLDLIGPGTRQDQLSMERLLRRQDPQQLFLRYRGEVPYSDLSRAYREADVFIFASSCETFGLILLEAMAAGLPIACSHRSAMPEVVGNAAVNFDPLNVPSIEIAISRLLDDDDLRRALSFQAQERARGFTWEKCASETFGFLREVYDRHEGAQVTTP